MTSPQDTEIERLAAAQVGAPVVAAGWFHVYADDTVAGGNVLAGVIGSALWWLARKRPWKLPSVTYWVVTDADLHLLEFRFGSRTRLRREVVRCERGGIRARRSKPSNTMMVTIPGFADALEVQGSRFDSGEAEVIRQLTGGDHPTTTDAH